MIVSHVYIRVSLLSYTKKHLNSKNPTSQEAIPFNHTSI